MIFHFHIYITITTSIFSIPLFFYTCMHTNTLASTCVCCFECWCCWCWESGRSSTSTYAGISMETTYIQIHGHSHAKIHRCALCAFANLTVYFIFEMGFYECVGSLLQACSNAFRRLCAGIYEWGALFFFLLSSLSFLLKPNCTGRTRFWCIKSKFMKIF